MNDVTKKQDQLPADFYDRMELGIADSRSSTILAAGGKPFMRLLKSGEWVFGQENNDVQKGSRWLVNTMTLAHGYCCWVDGELRGDTMVSMVERKPVKPAAIDGIPFEEQRSFELKCMDGADKDTEVLFKTNSKGGIKAIDGLLAVIQPRLKTRSPRIFPVLTLDASHYQHAKYGRIYTPILQVVGWTDINGAEEDKPAPPPSMPAMPVKVKKPPLSVVEDEPTVPGEPVATAQIHTGQRRRPTSR